MIEAFQKRMIDEYEELADKVGKLEKFINDNPIFDRLDKQERIYQVEQLTGMKMYKSALKKRMIRQNIMTADGIIA